MAKFCNNGPAIFQEPIEKIASDGSRSCSMGFRVAICDNGCGDEKADAYNAEIIVKALNKDDELKEIASWVLSHRPCAFLTKKRVALLEGIIGS